MLPLSLNAFSRKEENEAITRLHVCGTINFTTRAQKCLGNFSGGLPLLVNGILSDRPFSRKGQFTPGHCHALK